MYNALIQAITMAMDMHMFITSANAMSNDMALTVTNVWLLL